MAAVEPALIKPREATAPQTTPRSIEEIPTNYSDIIEVVPWPAPAAGLNTSIGDFDSLNLIEYMGTRPVTTIWTTECPSRKERILFFIDVSRSMGAQFEDGTTPLEAVLNEMTDMVKQLSEGTLVSLVAYSERGVFQFRPQLEPISDSLVARAREWIESLKVEDPRLEAEAMPQLSAWNAPKSKFEFDEILDSDRSLQSLIQNATNRVPYLVQYTLEAEVDAAFICTADYLKLSPIEDRTKAHLENYFEKLIKARAGITKKSPFSINVIQARRADDAVNLEGILALRGFVAQFNGSTRHLRKTVPTE